MLRGLPSYMEFINFADAWDNVTAEEVFLNLDLGWGLDLSLTDISFFCDNTDKVTMAEWNIDWPSSPTTVAG